jgi:hypothetical protein
VNNDPLINIHIEKTAGRSLRKLFIETYGSDAIMTYDPISDTFVRASQRLIATEKASQERLEKLVRNKYVFPAARLGVLALKTVERSKSFSPEDLPQHDYSVATGHFTWTRLENIISPDAGRYTSVIRDPLGRMLSHYDHWRRSGGLARFRVRPAYDPSLSFEQFALLPELQNYQVQALGESTDSYYLLGTLDKFDEYLEELGLIGAGQEVPHVNKSPEINEGSLSSMFLIRFEEFHEADYELYHAVKRRWN